MVNETPKHDFFFLANDRCLDFVNTEYEKGGVTVEMLPGFGDLVEWMRRAGLLSDEEAQSALSRWDGKPEGEGALEEAKAFRRVLREEVVERIIHGEPVELSAVGEINRHLSSCRGYHQLLCTGDEFNSAFRMEYGKAAELVGALAECAALLLQRGDFSLIKRCGNPSCRLYFYDRSKNHSRRWCCMSWCGNRMKVAAHYRRKRAKGGRADVVDHVDM